MRNLKRYISKRLFRTLDGANQSHQQHFADIKEPLPDSAIDSAKELACTYRTAIALKRLST
jgi:hypothetical protein